MFETILFDFDGTLTPSLSIWLGAFHHALSQYKITLTDAEVVKTCFYRPFEDVAADFGIRSGEEIKRHVFDGLDRGFVEASTVDGAVALIRHFRMLGWKTGLVTSSHQTLIDEALPRLGIDGLFDIIVTSDDVVNFKPHPEPVTKALRLLETAASTALFVGDSSADILAGQAAGVKTALFLPESHRPYYDFEALTALRPTFIFATYSELFSWLNETSPVPAHTH